MRDDIFAGIVLYNPNIKTLKRNIEAIKNQVSRIILIDNNSNNFSEISVLLEGFDSCSYIKLKQNFGIAKALNTICEWALLNGAKWVLTLDQDSECLDSIIDMYSHYLDQRDVGQITSLYMDRNFPDSLHNNRYEGVKEIERCITSAALLNLTAWKDVNGFDEYLFIDAVDLDICLTMKEKGYRILEIGRIGFIHEIGCGNEKVIWGHRIKTWNHSPFRRYYSTRNNLIIAKKHHRSLLKAILGILKHICIIFIFEDQKYQKLEKAVEGIVDGFKYKVRAEENL